MTPEPNEKAVREYYHENGCVLLYYGKQFYYFVIEKKLAPAQTLVHERGRMDYITAYDFFDTATRYIRDEIDGYINLLKTYNDNELCCSLVYFLSQYSSSSKSLINKRKLLTLSFFSVF